MKKGKTLETLTREVKVGDMVEYRSYPEAEPQMFKTRMQAEILSGHTSVVLLSGKAGCVSIEACKLIPFNPAIECVHKSDYYVNAETAPADPSPF
jgi:hypothetical protein